MRPPGFWQQDGVAPRLLAPVAAIVARTTASRVARPGWVAPVPVICCGNAGVGGAGKTTLALDLAARIKRRGIAVHCLSRGYGGRAKGVRRVDPDRDDTASVGDEPLLLAAVAPTWVGRDRAASARAAVAAGAQVLLMDDGLQNPTLAKTASLLVIDGAVGFGNGRVMPAGPLREPALAAAARCRAAVLIGEDRTGAASRLGLKVLSARLNPECHLDGALVLPFCGIARPDKFFDSVREAGGRVVARAAFPDHHRFSTTEIDRILGDAARLRAIPITTAKDAVRLSPAQRPKVSVLSIRLAWDDEARIEALLNELLP